MSHRSPSAEAKTTERLAELARYRGHWRRRNHRPGELRALAVTEASPARALSLDILADYLQMQRTGGGAGHPFGDGTVGRIALAHAVSAMTVSRVARRYKSGGLRRVFAQWLAMWRRGARVRQLAG